jgi:hypothetical protein
MPLVGALEDGLLITAVSIETRGPYLFAVDPDSTISNVDAELVAALKLPLSKGPTREGETGRAETRVVARAVGLEIGTLVVDQLDLMVVPPKTFDAMGRRIHGVLGRDVLQGSLALGVDRDSALLHLIVEDSFRPPTDAIAIPFDAVRAGVAAGSKAPDIASGTRAVIAARVNGAAVRTSIDLGAQTSQLREGAWSRAGLTAREVTAALVDDTGAIRPITIASEPARVALGGVTTEGVVFVPFVDRRWAEGDLDGSLGLDAVRGHDVWMSGQRRTLYLVPRSAVAVTTRIARWDSPLLNGCKQPGCAGVRVIDPLNGAPPPEGKAHPGLVLSVTREERAGGTPLEVVLEAQARQGLPRLVVNLPPNVDKVIHQLKPEFIGATLVVVDASMFPRKCPAGGGCVDQLAR